MVSPTVISFGVLFCTSIYLFQLYDHLYWKCFNAYCFALMVSVVHSIYGMLYHVCQRNRCIGKGYYMSLDLRECTILPAFGYQIAQKCGASGNIMDICLLAWLVLTIHLQISTLSGQCSQNVIDGIVILDAVAFLYLAMIVVNNNNYYIASALATYVIGHHLGSKSSKCGTCSLLAPIDMYNYCISAYLVFCWYAITNKIKCNRWY